jgi:glycosyltransferase involved in cell wall biosynthesis
VSAVIPTRNRAESLLRLLAALAAQERRPDEVLIVDASDEPLARDTLARHGRGLSITLLSARAHLPAQRNLGIAAARESYVLLCDDDIEPPPAYLRRLVEYLDTHPEDGAVSGALRERTEDGFAESFPVPAFRRLLFAFVFQLTVWGDVEGARAPAWLSLPLRGLRAWYRHRGNTWSLAGWPLVTQVRSPVVRTAVYGLGAALVRREWLLASPYEELLGAHGIGDNYGVAMGFPCTGVAVLRDLEVIHHVEPTNRLPAEDVYHERILALDYFSRTGRRRRAARPLALAWSLLGSAALFALQRNWPLARRALRAAAVVLTGRNPLLRARGPRGVGPAAVAP